MENLPMDKVSSEPFVHPLQPFLDRVLKDNEVGITVTNYGNPTARKKFHVRVRSDLIEHVQTEGQKKTEIVLNIPEHTFTRNGETLSSDFLQEFFMSILKILGNTTRKDYTWLMEKQTDSPSPLPAI